MIVRRKDMRTQVRTLMKGGKGTVTVLHLVEAEDLPNVRFVGHGPLFWKGISAEMDVEEVYPTGPVGQEGVTCELLARYDNLYADLSGDSGYNAVTRDAAFARQFLARFHRKILFGTDNLDLGLRAFLVSLELPPDALECILGRNAEELCGG